jgi:hypothetical protein
VPARELRSSVVEQRVIPLSKWKRCSHHENRPEETVSADSSTCFDLAVFFAFTGTLTSSNLKAPYQAILRPDRENKPNIVSTGERPLENLQSSFTRDTKVVSGDLFSVQTTPRISANRRTGTVGQYC